MSTPNDRGKARLGWRYWPTVYFYEYSRRFQQWLKANVWMLVLMSFSLFTIWLSNRQQTECERKWPGSRRVGDLFSPVCIVGTPLGSP